MASSKPPDLATAWQQSWEEWTKAWAAMAQPPAEGEPKSATPTEAWKRSMDRWLTAWAAFMEETTSTPEFAAASGQALSRVLDVQKPMLDQTEAVMQRWLEIVNMPSRIDIVRLASQLNEIAARLDEMGDRLDEIQDALADGQHSTGRHDGAPAKTGVW